MAAVFCRLEDSSDDWRRKHLERKARGFWAKVVKQDEGCWLWNGRLDSRGYGRFTTHPFPKGTVLAHRLAYILTRGEIPEGRLLHHTCGNRACVRPDHLAPITEKEHRQVHGSGHGKGRKWKNPSTHCIHGHAFTPENTYVHGGSRHCRACGRDVARRYKQRRATPRTTHPSAPTPRPPATSEEDLDR